MTKIYSAYTTDKINYEINNKYAIALVHFVEGFDRNRELPGNLVDICTDHDILYYSCLSREAYLAVETIRRGDFMDENDRYDMIWNIMFGLAQDKGKRYFEHPDGGIFTYISHDRATLVERNEIAESMKELN